MLWDEYKIPFGQHMFWSSVLVAGFIGYITVQGVFFQLIERHQQNIVQRAVGFLTPQLS
jgi:hypothetical protein